MSAADAMQALETIRHVRFQVHDETRSGISAKNPRARQVLNALKITELRPPCPPAGETTVM